MKRAHPKVIETPDGAAGSALLLRLPGHHQSVRLTGAAVLMWQAWKRHDLEAGVQAVLQRYRDADPERVRGDAERIHQQLEAAGLIVNLE